jgi:hypothetical protein
MFGKGNASVRLAPKYLFFLAAVRASGAVCGTAQMANR